VSVTITVHAGTPWAAITAECAKRGPRYAAIAYVGTKAPQLLRLEAGDVLVVNAGPESLLARATDPEALATFIKHGVAVYSARTLHAKMLATRRSAVIGSANASRHSESMWEAVTITTDTAAVQAVKDHVTALRDASRAVDDDFLDDARDLYAKGRSSRGAPGHDGGPPPVDEGLLPDRVRRVVVYDSISYVPTKTEKKVARDARRGLPRHSGAPGRYSRSWVRLDDMHHTLKVGDVVITVEEAGGVRRASPPVVVVKGPTPIPRSRGRTFT
jgi:hypothetical protein